MKGGLKVIKEFTWSLDYLLDVSEEEVVGYLIYGVLGIRFFGK